MVHDCDNVQGNKIMTPQALLQSKDSVHSPCVSCKKISISLRNRGAPNKVQASYRLWLPAAAASPHHGALVDEPEPGKACWVPAPQNLELQMSDLKVRSRSRVGIGLEHRRMSSFTFDEAENAAQLPKELGENVTRMLGGNQISTVFQPS